MTEPDEAAAQWAYLFNTFGKTTLREMLVNVVADTHPKADDPERRVIEFRPNGGEEVVQALDITDHVDELEDRLSDDIPAAYDQ